MYNVCIQAFMNKLTEIFILSLNILYIWQRDHSFPSYLNLCYNPLTPKYN